MNISNLSGNSNKVVEIIFDEEVICNYRIIRLKLADNTEIKGSLKSLNQHHHELGYFDIELVHSQEDGSLVHIDQLHKVAQLWLTAAKIEQLKTEVFVP